MITPLTVAEYTAMAIGLGAGIMIGIDRLKSKKYKIPGNPTRCVENRARIEALERGFAETSKSIASLGVGMGEVNKKVDVLLALHIKP